MWRPFRQVDVFTETPYRGNPLAVVLDGDELSSAAMQRFASWTNLSETTFVLAPTTPEADYRGLRRTAAHPRRAVGSAAGRAHRGPSPHRA